MIACPNDADYHWEDLLVLRYENDNLVSGPIPVSNAQLIETTIWEWQNGEYIQNSGSEFILIRNKGYWINTLTSGVYLRFPHDKAMRKRSLQTASTEWMPSDSFIQKAYAGSTKTPPEPMNAFEYIQVDPDVSNCFLETIGSQSISLTLMAFMVVELIWTSRFHRHRKKIGLFIIFFLVCQSPKGLASEKELIIAPGRSFNK